MYYSIDYADTMLAYSMTTRTPTANSQILNEQCGEKKYWGVYQQYFKNMKSPCLTKKILRLHSR